MTDEPQTYHIVRINREHGERPRLLGSDEPHSPRMRNGRIRCALCRSWKKVDSYYLNTDGLPRAYCKPCYNHRQAMWKRRRGQEQERDNPSMAFAKWKGR